jgi:sterol desaturase/sphingolipid hydroxylase (fatty acid hydroxylase superfamily)
MDLIALAAPFFLLALVTELILDWRKRTGFYRSNDAINSLSAGILSVTVDYFTRFLPLLAWGFVLRNLSLIDMQPEWFDLSPGGLLLWVIAALAWDFCYYWFHRFSHEISVLWAAHAVHHQSEDYNLSTALRQTSTGFLFGWIFYLPLFMIGFPLTVLITVNAINLIYQFWVHTQIVRRLGVLDRILVTPSNHRVHHAQNERYIDKNYGGMLILWDRFFGTFEDESEDEPVVFGVRKPLANLNPFWANLQVYDYLLFDARKAARWRDKVGIWFRRTGWRPADVEEQYPRQNTDLSRFRKFDPQTTPSQRHYVMTQFIIGIIGALLIAELYARRGTEAVLVPCVLLWIQLYTLGLLNEDRPSARRLEYLRLLVAVPVLYLLLEATAGGLEPKTAGWGIVAIYSIVSAIWLGLVPRTKERLLIH